MEERVAPPTLSRDEVIRQWVLNLAVEFQVPLKLLFPEYRWGPLNAREIPNVSSQDFARNLLELFDSGMIAASSEFAGDDTTTRSGFSLILDRFLALPKDFQAVRYSESGRQVQSRPTPNPVLEVNFGLTALGGEAWEKIAEPDWSRFISATTTYPACGQSGPLEGELISPNRDLLIAYMGWFPEVRREQIQLETIKWETRSDAEVLYWKRLPFLYYVSFQVQAAKPRPEFFKQPNWLWDWWSRTCYWYKQPWELPSWPSE